MYVYEDAVSVHSAHSPLGGGGHICGTLPALAPCQASMLYLLSPLTPRFSPPLFSSPSPSCNSKITYVTNDATKPQ